MRHVAITANGWGTAYSFVSRVAMNEHPIVQYGDAMLAGPADVRAHYGPLDLPRLIEFIGDKSLATRLQNLDPGPSDRYRERAEAVAPLADPIWNCLLEIASEPPTDAAEIVARIRSDRKQTLMESQMNDTAQTASDAEKAGGKAPAKAAAPKAEKTPKVAKAPAEPKVPRPPKYAPTGKIKLQADPKGVQYGSANNPKRQGSRAAIAFGKMTDGMTVQEYVAATGSQTEAFAELKYNIDHGFVKIEE